MSGKSKRGGGSSGGTILPMQVTTVNYAVGDNIRDPNTGVIFTCISATTASATPPSEDPTNWIGQDSSVIGIISPKGQITDHDGWLKVDGRAISRTKYIRLFGALTEDIEANITNGSNSLRVEPEDIDKLSLGATISGTGIPLGTTITAIGSTHADVTGSTIAGQAKINLDIGQSVSATLPVEIDNDNFPDNTTVTAYTAQATTASCKSVSGVARLFEPTTTTKLANTNVGDTFTHAGFTGTQTVESIPVTTPFTNGSRTETTAKLYLDASPASVTNESKIVAGQYVSGTGVPSLTTISAITSSETVDNCTFFNASTNLFLPFGEYNTTKYPVGRRIYHANVAQAISALATADSTKTGAFNMGTALFCAKVGQLPSSHSVGTVLTHPGLPIGTTIASTAAEGTLTNNRSISGSPILFFATGQSAPTVGQYISHSGFPGTPRFTAYRADQTLNCGFISASPILKIPVGAANLSIGQSLSATGVSGQISSIASEVVKTGNTNATITVSGIASTTGLVVGQFVSGSGIPANCRIATIVSGTSITLSAAATSTVTGVTLTFGQIVTMSANATTTSLAFAVIFGAYGTTDVTATSTVSGTTTFGGYVTASATCTGSETTSISLGSRLTLNGISTGAGANVSIKLGAIYTLSAATTASGYNTMTFGAWLNCANTATSTVTNTATFSGFLTVDQNATATAIGQTFEFGKNFTMSANATANADNGSFIIYAYGSGDGSTTFNLPDDPSGRALGFSGSGSGLTARGVNVQAGTETHTLTLDEMPAHTHTMRNLVSISQGIGSNDSVMDNSGSNEDTGSVGGGVAHNNVSPVAFLGYCYIYAGAI